MDEGLHEIQLNGKQLVFLFMSSTVVAVVIFLCGVMVGRGVRPERPALEAAVEAATDPTSVAAPAVPAPPAAVTSTTPVAAQETLTYPSRLEGQEPVEEKLKPAPRAATTAKAEGAALASTPLARREPASSGFVVQVAAVNDRREAESIASRLAGKGYPSFVTTPPRGAARMFRVRIGKYPTRREAAAVAARLQKEDQFKPWITK